MACPGRRDIEFLPTNNHQNARDWVLSFIYSTEKLSPYWSLLAHPARGAYLGFHVATKSITTPSCMGCQSISRLPPSISSGFPENSPEAIYTPGWRERHCERKVHAQEHKTLTRPGLEPRPLDPKSYALIVWRLCHPYVADDSANNAPTLKALTTCYRIQIAPGYARGVRLRFPLTLIIFCKAKNCMWKAP